MSSSKSLLEESDSILREYLTWRGFSTSLQAFAADMKEDQLFGLSSKHLVSKLQADVEALKLDALFSWWDEGVGPLLARVEEEVAALGRALRDSTYRWFLVACFKQQRNDLIVAFFKDHWSSRVGSTRFRDEWRRQWFALPYTSNPERDRYFSVFFSQEWKTTLLTSLETFLNSILSALPPPRMVSLAGIKDTMEALHAEIETLKLLRNDTDNIPSASSSFHDFEPKSFASTVEADSTSFDGPKTLEPSNKSMVGKRNGEILRVRFSPSCTYAAGCGRDATAVIWNFSGSAQKNPRLFCDSSSSCLDWFDDSFLCVGTLDHSIHLWHPPTPSNPSSKVNTLRTTVTMPWILDVAFDPSSSSGSTIIASVAPSLITHPGELQLWNLQTERLDRVLPVEPVPTRFSSLRFNHNGSLLVAGSTDGMIRVFDTSRSGAIMGWPAFTQGNGAAALCLSRSETSVFALSSNGCSMIEWSLHRVGEAIRKWTINEPPSHIGAKHQYAQADIATSGKALAAAYRGRAVIIPLETNSESAPTDDFLEIGNVTAVDWDENVLLTGGVDGVVCKYAM